MCLTYPHIGNVGANLDDEESARPYIEGLIVREFSALASNWRSAETAQQYLERHNVPVIWDIDTRALVRHIRRVGALRGIIATDDTAPERLVEEARALPSMAGLELAGRVSCEQPYAWGQGSIDLARAGAAPLAEGESRFRVVAYDFGIKHNILRLLVDYGCEVTVVPAATTAEDVLAMQPDGVFLSNGPGDPEPVDLRGRGDPQTGRASPDFRHLPGPPALRAGAGRAHVQAEIRPSRLEPPGAGLCKREKWRSRRRITVSPSIPNSLPSSEVEITHVNLNDGTNEGMRHRTLPLFSVQYHPEASPGPHDARYLFGRFVSLMREGRS